MRRRREDATVAAIIVIIVALIIVLACAFYDAAHGAKVGGEWVNLGPFNGGINTSSNKGQLAQGELLSTSNFIWGIDSRLRGNDGIDKGHLEVREGFYRFANPESGTGVEFMDIFNAPQGVPYLMYSDGVNLWYKASLTGLATALNFGRANSGTVDTYTGSKSIHGNTVASQKLRTIFGTYEGGTINIGGTDHTIDKIVLDTLVYVTAAVGAGGLAQNYSLDYSAIAIKSAFQMNNNYWIYSTVGKFQFSNVGAFTIVDSLTGDRYQYTSVRRACGPGWPVLKFNGVSLPTATNGKFLRIVTNPKSAGTPANPLANTKFFYMSYPIASATADSIKTFASAFMPDSTTAQYFNVDELTYDPSTQFITKVDSVRLNIADSAGTGCSFPALYLKLWCDTCFFDADTNWAISGDWFFAPRYSWTDGNVAYDSAGTQWWYGVPVISTEVFPVVGGFRGSDSAVYIVTPPSSTARNEWTINANNKTVAFYRMKVNKAAASAVGIEWATVFNASAFEVRSDETDVIYWSVPNLPDSFLVDSWVIVDHGNPLIIGAPQGGNLIVYTATNRWAILYGGGTSYAKQYLDGARGCIARGSFLNIDGVHYGLAADGYWETSGEAPRLISDAVATYFTDSLNFDALDAVAAGYDAQNDNIWISIPVGVSTVNNRTLVYNRASGSWWPQSFVGGAYAYNPSITVSDSVRFIVGGTDSSTLYVRGGDDDDGDSLVAQMQTAYYDYGQSQLIKNVKGLRLGYESDRATAWECESFGQNYVSGATFEIGSFTGTTVSGWSEQQMRFLQGKYRGKRLSHRLTFYDAAGLKLPYLQALVKMGVEE